MKNKGAIILTLLGALGGLLSIAADVGSLFVKEEPETPILMITAEELKMLEDRRNG